MTWRHRTGEQRGDAGQTDPAELPAELSRNSEIGIDLALVQRSDSFSWSPNMPPKATKNSHRPAALPEDDLAFVRLWLILEVFPIGESSWWRGVADGRFPRPVKLSPRVSAWRVADIKKLLAACAKAE